MALVVTNNAVSILVGAINSTATSFSVSGGTGVKFPSTLTGNTFHVSLVDSANNIEIVKVTNRTTDVFTVERAQEGTTARAYSVGDRVALTITAEAFNAKADKLDVDADIDATTATLQAQITALNESVTEALASLQAVKIDKEKAWPIGSIYINATSAVNPATLLGFGTWTAFGTGRTLVGIDGGNPLMDAAEELLGTPDATLVTHNHTTDSSGNIINASVSIAVESSAGGFASASGNASLFSPVSGETLGSFNFPGTYYTGFSINGGNHAHTTTSVGSTAVNKNYQPSIVVYMWKRTA